MTKVICSYVDCKYLKDVDGGYGICGKDEITLDEAVDMIFVGCPDAEAWDEVEE